MGRRQYYGLQDLLYVFLVRKRHQPPRFEIVFRMGLLPRRHTQNPPIRFEELLKFLVHQFERTVEELDGNLANPQCAAVRKRKPVADPSCFVGSRHILH